MKPELLAYKTAVFDFINNDIEVETLVNDCVFTEGPLWNSQGFYLFSDTPANVIYKIVPGEEKQIFLDHAGTTQVDDPDLNPDQKGSNGLAYDGGGSLLVCQHGNHAIARYNGTGLEPFISSYNQMPFNSPNDLIVHSNGSIYFTDPPYGLKDKRLKPEKFQPVAGVYCYRKGALQLICDTYHYPNGVCLSPDEKLLYICSSKNFEPHITVYDTDSNQFVKRLAHESSDGIECDTQGHLYLCNKFGIIVLNTEGKRLLLIRLHVAPSNICWGGHELKDLFITAREKVFLIRNLLK